MKYIIRIIFILIILFLAVFSNAQEQSNYEDFDSYLRDAEEEREGAYYSSREAEKEEQKKDSDIIHTKELEDKNSFIYTLLQPLPQEGEDLQKNVTLKEYLTWAFRFTLALAGFLAVMMIVIGGVEYIISGANEGMRTEAKKRISNAIWGLVMALAAYLVLYTINPSLVDFENNQFFKEETTTSSSDTSDNIDNTTSNDDTRWDENSTDNIGDFNDTTTDTGDIPI